LVRPARLQNQDAFLTLSISALPPFNIA
jgi:hypothetical protein